MRIDWIIKTSISGRNKVKYHQCVGHFYVLYTFKNMIKCIFVKLKLTLLLCPDQCTIAWLWDESPVKANVELLSFSSSCLGPAALRSSPLQRNSERATLRPATVPVASPRSWFWAEREDPILSPWLFLLARLLTPSTRPFFFWPLADTLETFICVNSLWPSSPFARRSRVFRLRLVSGYSTRARAHSADPAAQLSRGVSALAAPNLRSLFPKTCPLNPVADSLVWNFSSNSCPSHLLPGWHERQVISASPAWRKQGTAKSRNQNARCHFGQNMTSPFIAGGAQDAVGAGCPFPLDCPPLIFGV